MIETIDSFDGEWRFLSNFHPCRIRFFDTTARSVEHAFQAAKTENIQWRMKILAAETPGKAKRLGRKAPLRPDWDEVKVKFMHELLRRKFADPALAAKLLETRDATLIEGNTWGDTFWGVCKGRGENTLGQLLMIVREEVKKGCNFVTL